jgi:hypothetical protein
VQADTKRPVSDPAAPYGEPPWQAAQAYLVKELRARVEANRQRLAAAVVQALRTQMAAREAVWLARNVRAGVIYERLIARASAAARRSPLSQTDRHGRNSR